jgi:hypothetical protein
MSKKRSGGRVIHIGEEEYVYKISSMGRIVVWGPDNKRVLETFCWSLLNYDSSSWERDNKRNRSLNTSVTPGMIKSAVIDELMAKE